MALTRREFLKTGICAAGLTAASASGFAVEPPQARPNILFVFADQLRYASLGCCGNPRVRTPNIDKLAAQGALLTNAISGFPLCTPYRAMLLTGRYCQSTGVPTNDVLLPQSRDSFANVLARQGYQTGYIGKWHLDGHRRPYVPPERRQGFDYWVTENCNHSYFDTPTCFGDETQARPLKGYQPDAQTDLAVDYIGKHADKPFFLCMSWGPPHNPYVATKPYMSMYNPEGIKLAPNVEKDPRADIAHYYAQISNLDYNIGRLMRALSDAGIADNTIFVFTSDHGDMLGAHGQGIAKKQRPWEESIHIPFMVRFPGRIARGSKPDVLLNTVDVMPTVLGLAGVRVPSAVEGTDVSPVLLGGKMTEPESVLIQDILPCSEAAKAFGPWRGVRTKRHTYARFRDKGWVLYDNLADPYQLNNLIDKPEARTLQRDMEDRLQAWLKRTNDDFASAEEWQRRIGKDKAQ